LPDGVAAFPYVPFSAVMPRCAAIVHHGGIGTTGQALRSGRPAVIVPLAHDQFDNAARVRRLGAAESVPAHKVTLEKLVAKLRKVLEEPEYADGRKRSERRCRARMGR
jgi:UDP:flavonoid glycosyltransferase YjiC (YdhE family)